MNVVCSVEDENLVAAVRLALHLRWPDALVSRADGTRLIESTRDADMIFVDPPLIRRDGFKLLSKLRDVFDGGIVVLAAEPHDEEMLESLEAGADDYLPASFSSAQLVARVSVVLRRMTAAASGEQGLLHCGTLQISRETHEVHIQGKSPHLTPTEFDLLYHLALARGGIVTAGALHKLIWKCDQPVYIDTLRKYIQRLRHVDGLRVCPG